MGFAEGVRTAPVRAVLAEPASIGGIVAGIGVCVAPVEVVDVGQVA